MSRVGADAFLQELASGHGGRLTPDIVIAAAKPKGSPIHGYFTWDLKKAAQERWIDQARHLIQSVRIETTTRTFSVRAPAFIRDPSAAAASQGFVSLRTLRSEEDLAREAVVVEFARAASALRRAKIIACVLDLSEEIEDIESRIMQLSERAHQEGPSLAA